MPPTNSQLQEKVQELQVALDAEQQQVSDLLAARDSLIAARDATIVALEANVATLQAQIIEGGTDAERQALLDSMNATLVDLKSTVADAPPPPPVS